jgi:hypothetical protein
MTTKGSFLAIRLLVVALVMVAIPVASFAQIHVGLSITIGPPALPVYVQPACPTPGWMWTPGYWAYGDDGYYWVPGAWVAPPAAGLLWTPGYWGWGGGLYAWHAGYWGAHVGFYGGINYGFGYGGVGFVGGRWEGGAFRYNTAVTNVNVNVVHNTYVDKTVVVNNNTTINRTSFNGGSGTTAQPTAQERQWENEPHTSATTAQQNNEHVASTNKAQYASVNHGNPAVAGTQHAGQFSGAGVVGARGGATAGANANVRTDRPPTANGGSANGGNKPNNTNGTMNGGDKLNNKPNAEKPNTSPNNANNKGNTNNSNNKGKNPPPPKNNKDKDKGKDNGKGGKDNGKDNKDGGHGLL